MIRHTVPLPRMNQAVAILLILMLCGLTPVTHATPLAKISIVPVSPRTVSLGGNPVFNEVSSGHNNVAIGTKVYFQAVPSTTTLIGYQWRLLSVPSGSKSTIAQTSATLVTIRPDVVGDYQVALVPLLASKVTTATIQLIHAATWVGVGTQNTHATPDPHAPQCGTGYCHGGDNADPDLNVLPEWSTSAHAHKVDSHMSGLRGAGYGASCVSCHTVGYDTTSTAVNNGFDDVAATLKYNLTQINTLVADAVATGIDSWPQLPAELQAMANIQCENCHGPGSTHPSHLDAADHKIGGVTLDIGVCAQCHDSGSGHQQIVWQWTQSTHGKINQLSDAYNRTPCSECHAGEGFIDTRVNGKPSVAYPTGSHGATCSVCHDPHNSDNEHQLRIAGNFTFDSGQTSKNAGLGGLCYRCHNTRTVTVAAGIASSRGVHHGPQADMLEGINGYDFSTELGPTTMTTSAHATVVPDTCVECHMAAPTQSGTGIITPPKVGGHTWAMTDDTLTTPVQNVTNACGTCHAGLKTFDRTARADYDGNGKVEGIQTEVKGLMTIVKTAFGKMKLTDGKTTISTVLTIDPLEGRLTVSSTNFTKLSTLQKGVYYDYNYISTDKSFGVHNAAYTIQLLQRAYQAMTGVAVPGAAPRISIKVTNDAEHWDRYK